MWRMTFALAVSLLCAGCNGGRETNVATATSTSCNEDVLGSTCITIDSTVDGDALDCIRTAHPNAPMHASTKEAVDHLRDCTNTDATRSLPVTIVGHGLVGKVITGGGRFTSNDDVFMSSDRLNLPHWEPLVKSELSSTQTNRDGLVSLLSCDTGAESKGLQFLITLASDLQRPVRGRTGLAFCDGTFEANTCWLTVDPKASPPSVVHLPKRPKKSGGHPFTGGIPIPPGATLSLSVRSDLDSKSRWIDIRDPASTESLLELIDSTPGEHRIPLAVQTGEMKLTVGGTTLHLVILNDRLVQIGDTRNYFYAYDGFDVLFANLAQR